VLRNTKRKDGSDPRFPRLWIVIMGCKRGLVDLHSIRNVSGQRKGGKVRRWMLFVNIHWKMLTHTMHYPVLT
jgi:hypothetical protein